MVMVKIIKIISNIETFTTYFNTCSLKLNNVIFFEDTSIQTIYIKLYHNTYTVLEISW